MRKTLPLAENFICCKFATKITYYFNKHKINETSQIYPLDCYIA